MGNESAKCQHSDCEKWYPFEEGQKFCMMHRAAIEDPNAIKISRTAIVFSNDHVSRLNAEIDHFRASGLNIPQLAEHILDVESKMRDLARTKQAAMFVKKELEDKLSEEERDKLRDYSSKTSYREPERIARRKKTPEEKADNRKNGFSKWAARFDLKIEQVMAMDEDELAEKIAKYKKARGNDGGVGMVQ